MVFLNIFCLKGVFAPIDKFLNYNKQIVYVLSNYSYRWTSNPNFYPDTI